MAVKASLVYYLLLFFSFCFRLLFIIYSFFPLVFLSFAFRPLPRFGLAFILFVAAIVLCASPLGGAMLEAQQLCGHLRQVGWISPR